MCNLAVIQVGKTLIGLVVGDGTFERRAGHGMLGGPSGCWRGFWAGETVGVLRAGGFRGRKINFAKVFGPHPRWVHVGLFIFGGGGWRVAAFFWAFLLEGLGLWGGRGRGGVFF